MKSSFLSGSILESAAFAGISAHASTDLSLIRGSLQNTGVDADAAGVVQSNFTPNNPQLQARLTGLTPGATYHFTVDGVNEGDFVAAGNGRAELRFRLKPKGAQLALDFDPRGHLLAVNDGTADVLKMVFSGEEEPAGILVDERTSLQRAEGVTRGKVDLRYLEQKNQSRFIAQLKGLDNGVYTLYVDGQPKAEIDLSKGRSTQVVFQANAQKQTNGKGPGKGGNGHGGGNSNRLALDFDPRGEVVDLVKDGAVVFSGEMLAQVRGINAAVPAEAETVLTSTGADVDATATAELSVNAKGEREFSVEVENLPAGDYTLVIAGKEYTITVVDNAGTFKGEIEFSTDPDDGELLLDFDPAGQEIVIKQGTTTFFTGTVNGTLDPADTTGAESFELPLLNQGVVAGASGDVSFEADGAAESSFAVSVEGLAAGDYQLLVGGVAKATITVADNGGTLEGSVSFDTQPAAGELLLDFNPRGQTVAVSQNETVLLSRTLPN